ARREGYHLHLSLSADDCRLPSPGRWSGLVVERGSAFERSPALSVARAHQGRHRRCFWRPRRGLGQFAHLLLYVVYRRRRSGRDRLRERRGAASEVLLLCRLTNPPGDGPARHFADDPRRAVVLPGVVDPVCFPAPPHLPADGILRPRPTQHGGEMKLFGIVFIALGLTACAATGQEARSLFDGESLEGWERKAVHGGRGGLWTVEDGVIVANQEPDHTGGLLGTRESFSDVEVE